MGIVFGALRIDMKHSPSSISLPNLAVQFYKTLTHETRKKNNIRCRLRSRYWECHWRVNR